MQIVAAIVGVVVLAVALSLLFSLPVMWLWNGLMPNLFGLTEVTWLQAWGLSILSHLLFSSSVTNNNTSK